MNSAYIQRQIPALLCGMALLCPRALSAANLFVYSFNFSDKSYVAVSPYMAWSPAAVTASAQNSTWVPSDQFLAIQTDMPYNSGNFWGIQVFTDNTQAANAAPGGPPYNIPDYFVGGTFVPGGTTTGPLSPQYNGTQSIRRYDQPLCAGNPQNILPKSGLISQDGGTRIPLIWRLFDDLPYPAGKVPPITENPPCSSCDFDGSLCDWFFIRDKGDTVLAADGSQSSDWQSNFWYSTPISKDGAYYNVCSPKAWSEGSCNPSSPKDGRFQPTSSGGWTTQYLVAASNFHNGTRRVYSTTVFVELFVL